MVGRINRWHPTSLTKSDMQDLYLLSFSIFIFPSILSLYSNPPLLLPLPPPPATLVPFHPQHIPSPLSAAVHLTSSLSLPRRCQSSLLYLLSLPFLVVASLLNGDPFFPSQPPPSPSLSLSLSHIMVPSPLVTALLPSSYSSSSLSLPHGHHRTLPNHHCPLSLSSSL